MGGMQGIEDFLPTSLPPSTVLSSNSSAAAMLQLSSSAAGGVPESSSYGFSQACSSLNLFSGYEQQMMLAMTLMTQAQQGLQQLQTYHPGLGAHTGGTGGLGLPNNHFLNQAHLVQPGTTLSTPRGEDTASVRAHESSIENH